LGKRSVIFCTDKSWNKNKHSNLFKLTEYITDFCFIYDDFRSHLSFNGLLKAVVTHTDTWISFTFAKSSIIHEQLCYDYCWGKN